MLFYIIFQWWSEETYFICSCSPSWATIVDTGWANCWDWSTVEIKVCTMTYSQGGTNWMCVCNLGSGSTCWRSLQLVTPPLSLQLITLRKPDKLMWSVIILDALIATCGYIIASVGWTHEERQIIGSVQAWWSFESV